MNDVVESAKGIEQLGIVGVLAVCVAVGIYVIRHLKKNAEECEKARLADAQARIEEAKEVGEKLSNLSLSLGELRGEVNVMRSLNMSAIPKERNGSTQ